jgi:hypothetical protein
LRIFTFAKLLYSPSTKNGENDKIDGYKWDVYKEYSYFGVEIFIKIKRKKNGLGISKFQKISINPLPTIFLLKLGL